MEKKRRWHTVAVNSLVLEELKRLGETFSRPPSIPVVVLKGGALAFTLYPDASWRPLTDIDLLVPEEWLEDALALGSKPAVVFWYALGLVAALGSWRLAQQV